MRRLTVTLDAHTDEILRSKATTGTEAAYVRVAIASHAARGEIVPELEALRREVAAVRERLERVERELGLGGT